MHSALSPVSPRPYDRNKQLPRLLALWPSEVDDTSNEARLAIIRKLRRALVLERRRGRSGTWLYNLNRHLALRDALQAEIAGLSGAQSCPAEALKRRSET
jgi:hypothetical protein